MLLNDSNIDESNNSIDFNEYFDKTEEQPHVPEIDIQNVELKTQEIETIATNNSSSTFFLNASELSSMCIQEASSQI